MYWSRFAAECEAAGMRISTSKSEAMVLDRKKGGVPSPAECLREFVKERLSAAAEEIFTVFKQTIVEYEEEIDRQRRLLDIVWKPEIKLHRIELQHVCNKEEGLTEEQLFIQERNSSLDQEDPDPPQIKEEQEEISTGQQGEQLELKQETDTFESTPADEGK
ncbi:hypothetical protein L3Q82_024555 [Scortum barcoo]|uniref:Uncharacterized protein n=1 Tax=Scortum barcoo TaxID=214431 RepID=A0ACB8WPF2_9TELE|nr:hypothetical protein L3Q82_024555 [Scortum barcoo]